MDVYPVVDYKDEGATKGKPSETVNSDGGCPSFTSTNFGLSGPSSFLNSSTIEEASEEDECGGDENVSAIVGGVVGRVLLLLLVGLASLLMLKRRRKCWLGDKPMTENFSVISFSAPGPHSESYT